MTQVGQLIMLKTVPFYSLIRSFELRERFAETLDHFPNIIPKNREELTLDNAKWFIKTGYKKFKRGTALTIMIDCSKEYISISNGR